MNSLGLSLFEETIFRSQSTVYEISIQSPSLSHFEWKFYGIRHSFTVPETKYDRTIHKKYQEL